MATAFLQAAALFAQGDGISVTLSADRTSVGVNDPFQLTVSVVGKLTGVGEPKIQNLEAFQIAGRSSSSEISIVNGSIASTVSITYTVLPGSEGQFTLGPAVVTIGGRRYESNKVDLTVAAAGGGAGGAQPPRPAGPPAAPPQPAPPQQSASPPPPPKAATPDGSLFIRSYVDRDELYAGEQLTYTFAFYSRVRSSENPQYTPPTFNGFWAEEIDQQAQVTQEQVRNILYQAQKLRTALFPTVNGEATISEAKLAFSIRNIWDFFDTGRRIELVTDPVKVKVKPLPVEGRPDNFKGAVGDYDISLSLDKDQVKAGEALTLTVRIKGTGNIRSISELQLPPLDGFDIYDSKTDEKVDKSGALIRGTKTFEYVIVPRNTGLFSWPALEFSFFDPRQEQYKTVRTKEISFTVLPGAKEESPVAYRLNPASVVSLGRDIRYIKENPAALGNRTHQFGDSPLFWLAHFIPLVSVGGALLIRRHRGRLMTDRGYARLKGAGRKFDRSLKEASRAAAAGDFAAGYAALDRALVHFLGDRLNVETVGMTTDQIGRLLAEKSFTEELRGEVAECLDHFAYVRFAPQTGADIETVKNYRGRVEKIAAKIDRAV
ncbi:MAG: BatD family protein [Candidatus Glassbacteria bacterium]